MEHVHVVFISHINGHHIYVAKSRLGVERALFEYVNENWHSIFEGTVVPDEPQHAIDQYFDEWEDMCRSGSTIEQEYYEIYENCKVYG